MARVNDIPQRVWSFGEPRNWTMLIGWLLLEGAENDVQVRKRLL